MAMDGQERYNNKSLNNIKSIIIELVPPPSLLLPSLLLVNNLARQIPTLSNLSRVLDSIRFVPFPFRSLSRCGCGEMSGDVTTGKIYNRTTTGKENI